MKKETIKGVEYILIPAIEHSSCKGCCFDDGSFPACFRLTDCCNHIDKYGKDHIYVSMEKTVQKIVQKPRTVWIVKEQESGRYLGYYTTRRLAREHITENRYWNGFSYKPKVVVKCLVTEVDA